MLNGTLVGTLSRCSKLSIANLRYFNVNSLAFSVDNPEFFQLRRKLQ
jgi:hypothetical protein